MFRTLSDTSHQEWTLFKGLKPTFFTISLVNMEDETRNGPFSFYLPNMNSSTAEDGGVLAEYSTLGSLRPDIFTPEGQEAFNKETLKTSSISQVTGFDCEANLIIHSLGIIGTYE